MTTAAADYLLFQQQHSHSYYHHHGAHTNYSMDMELELLNEQFQRIGWQCLTILRFTAQWFFPLFFLVSQLSNNNIVLFSSQDAIDWVEKKSLLVWCWAMRQVTLKHSSRHHHAHDEEEEEDVDVEHHHHHKKQKSPTSSNKISTSKKQRQKQHQHHPPLKQVPKHMAVIMDGNRRYGREHLGSALRGHRAGGEKLREFVRWCRGAGVEMLTVYAFSTENWNRPQHEVDLLMDLFSHFFDQMLLDADEIGIRIRFMSSEPEKLPPQIRELMTRVELETRKHSERKDGSICVNVCASYGSRSAVAKSLMKETRATNDDESGDDCEKRLMQRLAVSFVEDACDGGRLFCPRDAELWAAPDVLIRTSGEVRLSNFLLLELAYAEMFFWDVTWPEVSEEMLFSCLHEFSESRERRMGK